jgi:hypothetical protein
MRRFLLSLATIGIASLGSTLPIRGQPLGALMPRALHEARQDSLATTVNDWRRWCCAAPQAYYAPPAYYPPQAYYAPPVGYAPPAYYPPQAYYPPLVVYTYEPESYYYNFHRSQVLHGGGW